MTEPEKQTRVRRTAAEIAAEKKAWLLKHEWAGPKEALRLIREAIDNVEEAQAACGDKAIEIPWSSLVERLGSATSSIAQAIPQEVR